MQKTKIEWADMTWNPVTGCKHGCVYCYAKKIADRFGNSRFHITESMLRRTCMNKGAVFNKPFLVLKKNGDSRVCPYPLNFYPTFHRYRLDEPQSVRKPQRIFVVSMGDLFGDWVPDQWILQVFEACTKSPQHKYMFLTKNPARYDELIDKGILPQLDNFWYGTTITDLGQPMHWNDHANTFLSVEPMLEPWPSGDASTFNHTLPELVIVGAETGNRKGKVIPEPWWIDNLVEQCRKNNQSVFMKDSLIPIMGESNMLRELPKGLQV